MALPAEGVVAVEAVQHPHGVAPGGGPVGEPRCTTWTVSSRYRPRREVRCAAPVRRGPGSGRAAADAPGDQAPQAGQDVRRELVEEGLADEHAAAAPPGG